jgi:hypothetical protein
MKRGLVVLFILLVFGFSLKASSVGNRIIDDSIGQRISELKEIINSSEWVSYDSVNVNRLLELIEFIENTPIDTVIDGLRSEADSPGLLFARDISKVKSADGVEGFVSLREKNFKLKQIEEDVREKFPLHSIVVPEDQFTGIYSKILLAEQQENDYNNSVIPYNRDTLSVGNKLKIIREFRDSITNSYRQDFIHRKVDQAQKVYLESVNRNNYDVLKKYNDSLVIEVNKHVWDKVRSLIEYVDQLPNNFTIYNLFDESVVFPMQNKGGGFKWVWLKNSSNDSIGIRIENIDRNSIRMLVDESVSLSRLTVKEGLEVGKISPVEQVKVSLQKVQTKTPAISPWILQGKAYSGFTQTYINDFWSQGGKSSASALTTFYYEAKFSKNKLKWESFTDAKLGLIYYLPDEGEQTVRNWHKNTDSFELNSRLGYSAFKKWYYSAEANFKTQFFLGYKNLKETNPSSAFFSPAYLTFSAGLDFKPGKDLSAFISPISLKTTYVTNAMVDETIFGLKEGETRHSRIGISGKFDFAKSILQNVSLKSKNSIFLNYGFNDNGEWQFIKLPDFDTETSVDFKVNQYITTQINIHLVYDKDVESSWTGPDKTEMKGTRLQVKEFFTLGISYKL